MRKNIRDLAGKPLIAWTIAEALKSKYIDRLILSSEDEEIIKIAKQWGCDVPFVRPVELAQDDTPSIMTIIHALETIPEKYDYIILLQPTSPLRIVDDIDNCLSFCIQNKAPACISVSEASQYPFWMYKISKKGLMKPFIRMKNLPSRRQDLPKAYIINGAVYVAKVDHLCKNKSFINPSTVAYVMPKMRSFDIDEEIDLTFCGHILGTM